MKRILHLAVLLAVIAALFTSTAVAAQEVAETVDVIILAEGSTDGLVAHIQSLGGVVKFQYKNVPAVAAAVPADKLGEVASYSSVVKVEKDKMVYLTDRPEVGDFPHPLAFDVDALSDVEVQAIDLASVDLGELPEGYANSWYTGAVSIWGDTFFGDGTIVAVVDTGTYPNFCIDAAVIGAPGFPDGYNATGDGIAATSPYNHWHGTHVGGVIASWCAFDFSGDPPHPIGQAAATHLGWPVDFVPVFGQAPGASLYPVKVFPASGAGVPTHIILKGLDHVLTLKKTGALDIDIVNMSLGGPTLWDGRDTYDRFMAELSDAGILVVTSAGNEGPIPNSVGSPATSFSALSVGALDYAPSSRTFYEYLGLAVWPGAPGQGLVMRPTDELRVVNYSSRGPLSDGRFGPEIAALGHWNFQISGSFNAGGDPIDVFRWAGGTSFSSPTVAGAAALLNAYWESLGEETDPEILENVLLLGADPDLVGELWHGVNDQGYGTLDIPASLDLLMDGNWKLKPAKKAGELNADVLGKPVKKKTQVWESGTITLSPSEPFDVVFEIGEWTSNVLVEVFEVDTYDNWDYAYWSNALEVHLQTAKRTAFGHPVEGYWLPYFYGDSFALEIQDGAWNVPGPLNPGPPIYQPMEPGLMKLSLIGDYSNEDDVSFRVRITRENNRPKYTGRVANGVIKMGEAFLVPVDIPEGVSTATFDLVWLRVWNDFPTSDVDMLILDPEFNLVSFDGATGNAPERAVIDFPIAGTWYVLLDAYEMYKPDNYDLYLTLE